MARPRNLDEAKAVARAEGGKVWSSLSAIAGSRWLMAILAAFAMAFGVHLLYAPERLPTVQGWSFVQVGLPPNLDFGLVGEKATAFARDHHDEAAAVRDEVNAEVSARADTDAGFVLLLNWIGFGAAFVLLLGNLTLMTARRQVSRG